MKAGVLPLPLPVRGPVPWRVLVWGGLAAVLLLAAAWPYVYLAEYVAGPVALGVALVGYLPRRRWSDAAWLAVPALLASAVEPGTATRVFAFLALPIFLVTLRPRFAAAVAAAAMTVLVASMHLKLEFGGTRLTWQDLRFFFFEFTDNAMVFASQPTLLLYAGLALLVLAAVLFGAWRWDGRKPAAVRPRARWMIAVPTLALLAWTGSALADQAVRLRGHGRLNTGLVAQIPSFPFARFLETVAIRTAWAEPLVDTGPFRADVRRHMAAAPAATPADIVVFLQESQFNPATLEDCRIPDCRMPVFGAGASTHAHGPMRVHVFGAGTWLSEFAVATGVPHDVFGEGGDFAPFTVAPGIRRSFVRSLRDAGYHTVAVYPVRGNMMNARKAYHAYGYDRFYDSNDLGISNGWDVSDRTMHEAALRVLERERAQGKPVLLFVVTIFNHSEHGIRMERVPSALQAAVKPQLEEKRQQERLADYLWRTREFQDAMGHTERAVLGGPRPAVVAWFGDHQPPFTGSLALRPEAQRAAGFPQRLETWYHVGSNVRRPSASAAQAPLDIALLPGVLAQAAGAPLDELLAANVAVREQCGGLLRECRQPQARDAYFSLVFRDLEAFSLP